MLEILLIVIAVLAGIAAGTVLSKKFSEGCPP